MFVSALIVLLLTVLSVRFPEIAFLSLLPPLVAVGWTVVFHRTVGMGVSGLLAAAYVLHFPGQHWYALGMLALPMIALGVTRLVRVHVLVMASILLSVTAYVMAVAGSHQWTIPTTALLDFCVALALSATLTTVAYASIQRERLGPRGRTGFGIR